MKLQFIKYSPQNFKNRPRQKKALENNEPNSPVFIKRENQVNPLKKSLIKAIKWTRGIINGMDKVKLARAIAWFVNPTIYVTFAVVYFILM